MYERGIREDLLFQKKHRQVTTHEKGDLSALSPLRRA
jgi:hypothetical protein